MYQYSACRTFSEILGCNYFVGLGMNQRFDSFITTKGIGNIIENIFDVDYGIIDGQLKYSFDDEIINQCFSPFDKKITIEKLNLFIRQNLKDYTLLNGFYSKYFYFEKNDKKIHDWFKFKNQDYSILNKYNPNDYCYIHFRGTDFYQFFGKEFFLTDEYYQNAVKFFDVDKFVIFTDDIPMATKYFEWMNNKYEYKIVSNSVSSDLFTLTRSKYFIGSYSTFSEWAGFLNIYKYDNFMLFPYVINKQSKEYNYHIERFYDVPYFNYLTKNGDWKLKNKSKT